MYESLLQIPFHVPNCAVRLLSSLQHLAISGKSHSDNGCARYGYDCSRQSYSPHGEGTPRQIGHSCLAGSSSCFRRTNATDSDGGADAGLAVLYLARGYYGNSSFHSTAVGSEPWCPGA